ncbi:FimV family protein [Alishewanella sp. SMS8]|uniref:type IV pilus assembly protein FimV n=1 Tax=Alishewanella sp. SMS8 TaxID=2994676 RepID=UPI002740D375|nr:FimV/HubP family polar landmark protein [Alishewanella sp. SMS8]MDP5459035.1 FimV/HubP family polar landmark protein [Alishewanella sp. SMS8]
MKHTIANLCCAVALLTGSLTLHAATPDSITAESTLWRLALAARPDEQVSMAQVMYALWQQNPKAFRDNNVNYLLKGAELTVPNKAQMLATDVTFAAQWYQQQLARQALPGKAIAEPKRAVTAANPEVMASTSRAAVSPVSPPTATIPSATAVSSAAPARATLPTNNSSAKANTSARTAAIAPAPKPQGSWRWQHELDFTQRMFSQSGLQPSSKQHSMLSYRGQWSYENASRQHSVNLEPYLRWHQRDSESHLIDFQQAYWRYVQEGWEVKVGLDTIFWGVSESQHLVDVINQTDVTAGVELEAKLGQPMLALRRSAGAGTLDIYVLPYFRERQFPGLAGRLATPLAVNHDLAWYESSKAQNNLDVALRYAHRFSGLDVGLSFFSGTSREPLLQPTVSGELQPLYYQMEQYGLDLQWVQGDWIWKMESIYRRLGVDEYAAATAGFEFTQYGVLQQVWDLGWIVEYQYDSRGQTASMPGQNDLFIGWRLALNDVAGSSFLVGVLQDLDERQSRSIKLEGSRRLTDSLRLSINAWLFQSEQINDPLYWLQRDDYLSLQLSYYF